MTQDDFLQVISIHNVGELFCVGAGGEAALLSNPEKETPLNEIAFSILSLSSRATASEVAALSATKSRDHVARHSLLLCSREHTKSSSGGLAQGWSPHLGTEAVQVLALRS